MFLPDTAISSREEDQLGRSNFAIRLAETLRDWKPEDSLVVALYGSWGTGKTSILNMTIEHIRNTTTKFTEDKRPIIVRFNPWNFSSQNQILAMFFSQLLAEVEKGVPKLARQLRPKFTKYGQIISAFSSVPAVGGLIGTAGKLLQSLDVGQDTNGLRNEIDQLFKKINRRIIIVMDDLDRLTQAELRLVFQLIKLNANFPNTIYLIAADPMVVEKSLDTEQGISGREYLKKIVQVGFGVPPIDPVYINNYLFARLESILQQVPLHYWNEVDFANMYYTSLKPLFNTLRDVKRFNNGLAFNLRMVSSEVNTLDFIGLEALRIFLPEIYEAIAENKYLFITTLLQDGIKGDQLKARYEEIFAKAGDKAQVAQRICVRLFPKVANAFGDPAYGPEWQTPWSAQKRLCAEDKFDMYFLLGVPSGEISQAELDMIKSVSEDRTQLRAILKDIIETNRFFRLLERLGDIFEGLSDMGARNLIIILFEVGDEFEDECPQPFRSGIDQKIVFLISAALGRFTEDERCQWLQEQIHTTPVFYTFLDLISYYDYINEREPQSLPVSPECLAELKSASVQKIVEKYEADQLKGCRKLELVLSLWRKWNPNTTQLDDFVNRMMSTPNLALILLTGFVGKGVSGGFGDPVWAGFWRIEIDDLASYVDLGRLDELLANMTEDEATGQSERHQAALKTYRKIRQAQQQNS